MKKINFFIARFSYLIILILLAKVGCAERPDTLSFLHVSDIHLIFNLDFVQKDLAKNREHYGFGVAPFGKFLKNVPKETGAGFVVATGDLIDFYKGEIENNKLFGSQVEQFGQLLNKNNIPVYATLGNHDITEYSWGDSTRLSSQAEAGAARATWIKNVPCFQNGTYYSHIFHVGKTTYRFIFLDDGFNLFDEKGNYEVPYIDKAQQNWLKAQFDASAKDIEIVFMHIPIRKGDSDVNENSIYSVLSSQPSLKMVVAGHNHRNAVIEFDSGKGKFYQVQTAAFATDRNAWRLIQLTKSDVIISVPGEKENELIIPIK